MTPQQVYVTGAVAAIVVLLAVVGLVVGRGKKKGNALSGLALAFVLAGLLFGQTRVTGYGLLGVGILLAIIDIVRKLRSRAADQS